MFKGVNAKLIEAIYTGEDITAEFIHKMNNE